MSRKQFTILVLILAGIAGMIVAFKVLSSPGGPVGAPSHITVGQAMAGNAGEVVKAGGEVAPGSINWNAQALRFTLTGEGDRMQVVYEGLPPNDFKPGAKLVVEGTYALGVFQAISLTTQTSALCKTCHNA